MLVVPVVVGMLVGIEVVPVAVGILVCPSLAVPLTARKKLILPPTKVKVTAVVLSLESTIVDDTDVSFLLNFKVSVAFEELVDNVNEPDCFARIPILTSNVPDCPHFGYTQSTFSPATLCVRPGKSSTNRAHGSTTRALITTTLNSLTVPSHLTLTDLNPPGNITLVLASRFCLIV